MPDVTRATALEIALWALGRVQVSPWSRFSIPEVEQAREVIKDLIEEYTSGGEA